MDHDPHVGVRSVRLLKLCMFSVGSSTEHPQLYETLRGPLPKEVKNPSCAPTGYNRKRE